MAVTTSLLVVAVTALALLSALPVSLAGSSLMMELMQASPTDEPDTRSCTGTIRCGAGGGNSWTDANEVTCNVDFAKTVTISMSNDGNYVASIRIDYSNNKTSGTQGSSQKPTSYLTADTSDQEYFQNITVWSQGCVNGIQLNTTNNKSVQFGRQVGNVAGITGRGANVIRSARHA